MSHQGCHKLRKLTLRECELSDRALEMAATRMPALVELDVAGSGSLNPVNGFLSVPFEGLKAVARVHARARGADDLETAHQTWLQRSVAHVSAVALGLDLTLGLASAPPQPHLQRLILYGCTTVRGLQPSARAPASHAYMHPSTHQPRAGARALRGGACRRVATRRVRLRRVRASGR